MSVDDTTTEEVSTGTDRRTALKKAAIAAGVVAWTTPAVQAVTARPRTPGRHRVLPVVSVTASTPGHLCSASIPQRAVATPYVLLEVASRAVGRPARYSHVKVSDITGDPKPGCQDTIFFRDLLCAGGDAHVKITAEVSVPMDRHTQFDQVVSSPCVSAATLDRDRESPLS